MYKTLPLIKKDEIIYKNLEKYDWPCKPRIKPMALEDSTHDLPQYQSPKGSILYNYSIMFIIYFILLLKDKM